MFEAVLEVFRDQPGSDKDRTRLAGFGDPALQGLGLGRRLGQPVRGERTGEGEEA